MSLMGTTAFTTAVLFYFLYNETLQLKSILGMIMLVSSIGFISFSHVGPSKISEEETISIFIPIAIVLGLCITATFNAYLTKTYCSPSGFTVT